MHDPNRILTKEEYVNHSYRNEEEDTAVVIAAKSNQVNQADKELFLDIGNAATEDSASNIDVADIQEDTWSHEGHGQLGLQKIAASNDARILDGIKQAQVGSLREVQGEPTSRWKVTEENVLRPSSKLPWTCPGHSLRGPAHDLKEEEVTGYPLHVRSGSVGGTAGGRTILFLRSQTHERM